jgi:hypothetical protein
LPRACQQLDEGRAFAASIPKALPHYSTAVFLEAYRFAPDKRLSFSKAASGSDSSRPTTV